MNEWLSSLIGYFGVAWHWANEHWYLFVASWAYVTIADATGALKRAANELTTIRILLSDSQLAHIRTLEAVQDLNRFDR